MPQFYGERKIRNLKEEGDFIFLELDDETIKLTKKMYEASVSPHRIDATELWEKQLSPVVKEILETMLKWDLGLGQLDYLINLIKSSLEHNLKKSNDILWGKPVEKRRLSDINEILLKSNGQKRDK